MTDAAPAPAPASPPAPAPAGPILVLHAPSDAAFARGYLAPALGLPASGALGDGGGVLSAAELAKLPLAEQERLIRGSRVLVVATPALLADPVVSAFEELASGEEVAGHARVIPLVLEDVALPPHLGNDVKRDFRRRKDWDREASWLREQLARPEPVDVPPACPYPGMKPYAAGDAARFHGRSAEIAEILARLAAGDRELYVIGPSGCGKSSLITAGVLPRLQQEAPAGEPVLLRTLRPGSAPAQQLAQALASSGADANAKLVLFVDQLEELFTQADAPERARFAAALRAVRDEPRCALLLAVRADFYAELLESELWRDGAKRHVDVLPLRGAALREAIEQPAHDAGVYFERGLVDRLLADAADEPGVLPLLQETLLQLWGKMHRRLLTLADYEALGEGGRSGLAVAISSRADHCLRDEMTEEQRALARRTLLRLVSFGEGRPNTRRQQPRAALEAGEPASELEAVLAKLTKAGLITLESDERTHAVEVDLSHEALIAAWPSFAAWVEARRADEQRRRQLQASADEWTARGRGESGLLDAGELAAADAWRQTDAAREVGETPEVTALIAASRRALGAARRRRRWLIGGALGILGAFAAVAAVLAVSASRQADAAEAQRRVAEEQRRAADEQRRAAERLLGEQDRELGRQLVVDGRDEQAIPYLISAREHGVDDPMLRALFRTATLNPVVASVRHGAAVTSASFSRDGARLATSSRDGTARVWDAHTGAPLTPPLVHPASVTFAELRGDGARLLTVSRDDTARIWDLTARPPAAISLLHGAPIEAAHWSADGARVVTAGGQTARVWSAAGQPVCPPLVHRLGLVDAALSPDGARVVTASGLSADLWECATGRHIAELPTTAHRAVFSPSGASVLTAGADRTTQNFDAATGELLREIPHDANVIDIAFGRDTSQLAVARSDGEVWIYGDALRKVFHPPSVRRVAWNADGTRLLTEGYDQSVRVWDPATSMPLLSLKPGAGASAAAISPDGAYVITPGADGVARIWRVAQAPRELGPRIADAAYSPDGSQLAVLADGELQLWSPAGQVLRRAPLHEEPSRTISWQRVLVSPDGGRLAAITPDYEVQIWNPATGATRFFARGPDYLNENVPLGHPPPSFAFSPDGRRFVAAAAKTIARVWDSDTGAAVTPPLPHPGQLSAIRFSPDGRRVVTAAEGGAARIWDAATGQPGPMLVHPQGVEVVGVELSPDGARIATIASDQLVRIWDAATGQLGAQLEHAAEINSVVFAPDGARILTACVDRAVRLWDVASGELAAPPIAMSFLISASFSPDGARIVTMGNTSDEHVVQVWDAATGKPLTPPRAHPATVRTARFRPDGGALLTIAFGQIRIWDAGLDARTLEAWHQLAERGALRRRAL